MTAPGIHPAAGGPAPAVSPSRVSSPGRARGGGGDDLARTTAASDLAAAHLSLCAMPGSWRLERSHPSAGELWPPGTPAPLVMEAADLAGLGPLPGPLMPVAGFRGQRRTLATEGQGIVASVLDGTLRGMAQERPRVPDHAGRAGSGDGADQQRACRNRPAGGAALVAGGRGHRLCPRLGGAQPAGPGAPEVPPGTSVGDSVALVVGHLTDVILAGVPAASAGETADAVHAMRVAVRRLRSALSVFRKVTEGPALQALKPQTAGAWRGAGPGARLGRVPGRDRAGGCGRTAG